MSYAFCYSSIFSKFTLISLTNISHSASLTAHMSGKGNTTPPKMSLNFEWRGHTISYNQQKPEKITWGIL